MIVEYRRMIIEDACGVSSPHPQAICGYCASILMTKIMSFFCDFVVILEVKGPPRGGLQKTEKIQVWNPNDLCFWIYFRPCWLKFVFSCVLHFMFIFGLALGRPQGPFWGHFEYFFADAAKLK